MSSDDTAEMLGTLKRIEELLGALAKASLAGAIETLLSDPKHRLIYEKAGQIPRDKLAKKTEISGGKISMLWQRWERAGLMVKEGKSYRSLF